MKILWQSRISCHLVFPNFRILSKPQKREWQESVSYCPTTIITLKFARPTKHIVNPGTAKNSIDKKKKQKRNLFDKSMSHGCFSVSELQSWLTFLRFKPSVRSAKHCMKMYVQELKRIRLPVSFIICNRFRKSFVV